MTALEIALTCVLAFGVLAGAGSFVITLLEVRRLWAALDEHRRHEHDLPEVRARVSYLEAEAGINPEWLRKKT